MQSVSQALRRLFIHCADHIRTKAPRLLGKDAIVLVPCERCHAVPQARDHIKRLRADRPCRTEDRNFFSIHTRFNLHLTGSLFSRNKPVISICLGKIHLKHFARSARIGSICPLKNAPRLKERWKQKQQRLTHGRGKKYAVKPIEHAPMPWHNGTVIFDAKIPLDQ